MASAEYCSCSSGNTQTRVKVKTVLSLGLSLTSDALLLLLLCRFIVQLHRLTVTANLGQELREERDEVRGDATSVLFLGFLFLCSQGLASHPEQKRRKTIFRSAELKVINTVKNYHVCPSPPSCPDFFQQVASPPLPVSWRTPSAL